MQRSLTVYNCRKKKKSKKCSKSVRESVPELQDQGGGDSRHRGSLSKVGEWFSVTCSYFRIVSHNVDALRGFSRWLSSSSVLGSFFRPSYLVGIADVTLPDPISYRRTFSYCSLLATWPSFQMRLSTTCINTFLGLSTKLVSWIFSSLHVVFI